LNKKKASTKFDGIKGFKKKACSIVNFPKEFQFNQYFLHDAAVIQLYQLNY